ncbi:MAG: transposase [Planctomycetes bacterium]|nr:transposase [Planctomycetota bacterium]
MFGWQEGFGAFTVSVSQKDRVARYVRDQVDHHAREAFADEYLRLLNKHEVEYDPRYVWD